MVARKTLTKSPFLVPILRHPDSHPRSRRPNLLWTCGQLFNVGNRHCRHARNSEQTIKLTENFAHLYESCPERKKPTALSEVDFIYIFSMFVIIVI